MGLVERGSKEDDGKEGVEVPKIIKACKNCSSITEDDVCARCGGETSKDWQGYVIIIDHTKSEIAKKMEINANGRYALKVR